MELITNDQLQLATEYVNHTGIHIFLTGKAGTGKTTFLHQLRKTTSKRLIVTAPTGVAAINAGGVTIHSFFQLPFGPQVPEEFAKKIEASDAFASITDKEKTSASRLQKMTREKINIIKSLDLLVIDEISMVRADLLDAIDAVLRRYRNRNVPFGGVQLLMIGDLQQLAPVAKEEDWEILRPYYDSVFFFSSLALKKTDYISIELTEIFRQQDQDFIALLNKVRDNQMTQETIQELNKRYQPDFKAKEEDGFITLTSHNIQSQEINQRKLESIPGKTKIFEATVSGEFPEYSFPTESQLKLKTGSQVMFVKNDPSPEKAFYNGRIGTLIAIEAEKLIVRCKDGGEDIEVGPLEWNNCRYNLDENTKEIHETVIGTFWQYPVKLAWAITIHKSQGLTFDKVIIDAQAAFTHGQVYVALSRCRTLEGMVLSSPIEKRSVRHDTNVNNFVRSMQENPPGKTELELAKEAYKQELLNELFSFEPLMKRIFNLSRVLTENKDKIDAAANEALLKLIPEFKSGMVEIGDKFKRQLSQLIIQSSEMEDDSLIQDRIQKAVGYFRPLLLQYIQTLHFEVETDNSEARKNIEEALQRLHSDFHVREKCLLASSHGFYPEEYIETRAKASIDSPEKKKNGKFDSKIRLKNANLYKVLKKWRDEVAEEMNLRPDEVLAWKSLMEISETLPENLSQLKSVKGIGKKKLATFGEDILEIISEFTGKKLHHEPTNENDEKASKKDTKSISFELFKSGKSIPEIASERNFAESTIIGHLANFVKTGDLAVNLFLNEASIDFITEYFLETRDLNLKRAKEVLGENYSYGDIKLVICHLEYLKKIDDSFDR